MKTERRQNIKEHWFVKNSLKVMGWLIVIGVAVGVINEIIFNS
jgi:hypothetical protein